MKNSNTRFILFLVIGLVIGFGGSMLINGGDKGQDSAASTEETKADDNATGSDQNSQDGEKQASTIPAEYEILKNKSCIQCHSVDALNIDAGKVGPDLSNIYNEIGDKRGKTLDEFLTQPTTAVMSSVIGGNPLSDEERSQIIEILKEASEK